jgi:hypothetical protein
MSRKMIVMVGGNRWRCSKRIININRSRNRNRRGSSMTSATPSATLWNAVEEGARQPIAVPNEQEDGCIQVQGVAGEVEVEAGPFAAYKHDVECDDKQGCQEPVDPIHSVEQQFGPIEGY